MDRAEWYDRLAKLLDSLGDEVSGVTGTTKQPIDGHKEANYLWSLAGTFASAATDIRDGQP